MILDELCSLYARQSLLPESLLGSYGFQYRRLDFIIEIDRRGIFQRLLPTKNLSSHQHETFLLPMEQKRARQIAPHFLWDQVAYVLGLDEDSEDCSLMPKKVAAFYQEVLRAAQQLADHTGLQAVRWFYEKGEWRKLATKFARDVSGLKNPTLSFRLHDEENLICQSPEVVRFIETCLEDQQKPKIRCMISGEEDELALVHPAIKGLKGALGTGSTLISFNQDSTRFYGKKQGENAPIGKRTAFAYTSALNYLLRPDSEQVVHFNELSLLYWSEAASDWEQGFAQFLTLKGGQKSYDAFYRDLLQARWEDDHTGFFILALSVQKTRISVRYWQKFSIHDLQKCLREFFSDLHLHHAPYEAEPLSLYALAAAMAGQQKAEAIESHRFLELFSAIFAGKMYPQSLFCITMGLIRKEKKIAYHRAAIIKAYLVRLARYNQVQEEVGVALDISLTNIGYCLGRLFAVLEKLHEAANHDSSNLRDRFYTTASTSPGAVFPNILRQKNIYFARISNRTLRDRFEREIAEIFAHISEIPTSLNIQDQGRFVIGYYHQRQSYFTSRGAREHEQLG